jgi:peptide/nickel transport system ATP-binding protein
MEANKKKRIREIKKYNLKKYRELKCKNRQRNVPESEYLTSIKDKNNLLEIQDLHTYFYTDVGTVKALDGVTFEIPIGKTVGVVGESGCGKSVTSLSIMRILQEPQGQIASGQIRYNQIGQDRVIDLAKIPVNDMRYIRGGEISMIFQEPMTSLNPVFTVGRQLDEAIELHDSFKNKSQIEEHSINMLKTVGIANAEGVYKMYPHELSGGMRQRVVIAMALACNPKLVIADEPTTALDVTVQAQILDLLRNLKSKINASIMLITHDLGVVAEMADYVVVMYAGRIIEKGTAGDIFHNPAHPYTIGLMKSRPSMKEGQEKLYSIPGNVPSPVDLPDYCYFRNRCSRCLKACDGKYPEMISLSETHKVCCYLYEDNDNGVVKADEQ